MCFPGLSTQLKIGSGQCSRKRLAETSRNSTQKTQPPIIKDDGVLIFLKMEISFPFPFKNGLIKKMVDISN